jgi:hypothetical protein
MRFNIIASFKELDQDIIDIDLPDAIYTKEDEEQFIRIILNCIDKESVKQLIKLSVWKNIKKSQCEGIQWLMDRDGKYYFNYDVNNDADTKRWRDFKNNYL